MLKPYGIIPPIVTPLDEDETLNEASLRQLVNHMIENGVHGIFPTGSTGEFWAFDQKEKSRIFEVVVDEVGGRLPTYAGTMAESTREAVTLTRMAEEVGVDAAIILTPYYISPSPQELYDHYTTIARSTSLPIVIYNNPGRTGVSLDPETLSRLVQIENIVGIKDSSGDLSLTEEYVHVTPDDFAVLMGRDNLILPGLQRGCVGTVAATANIVPGLVVEIYERFKSGDIAGAQEAQERLSPLRQAFTLSTFPAVIKEAVNLIGIPPGPACKPVRPMSEEAKDQLTQLLKNLSVLST